MSARRKSRAPVPKGEELPRMLGPYRLLERLGTGAMGTVYRAEEEGRPVALKVFHAELLERKGFFRRFGREARAGSRIDHENVVRTLDHDLLTVDGTARCLLVMEYVRGRTLREVLADLRVVPEALVREIAVQIAAGLEAIHGAGVVHRDIKPENVLITDDQRVRIMDLGIARIEDATTALTSEGQFAGTLPYAAPEQFRGGPVGPAADLYSLGVVLHELAAGTNPFRRNEAAAVMRAHLVERPPALAEITPDVSPFLSEVVSTLLEKDPSKRFPSAGALKQVLREGDASAWWAERREAARQQRSAVPRVPVRRETALYGREADLALLTDLWAKARDGRGNTLLLEGEAGIGKSRLTDALLEDLDGQDAHVLYGSYPPAGGLGGITEGILGKFGAANLAEALAPYLTVTPTLVAPFAALLRNEAPAEGAPSLAGDALHAAMVHLMRGLAAEKPLLWVVEDLHFAGAESRKILLSLARAVEGHRVFLLLTTRPSLPPEEAVLFGRVEIFKRTVLGRLSAREVILLLRDAFKNERLVEKLGPRIAEKSDGVPYFLFEMIRGLKEGQFITEALDGSWVESKVIDEIEVPSAVKDLIGVRLRDLTREERAVLDVGAVLGYEFDPALVAQVLERKPIAVLRDLAEVERRSGVVRVEGRHYRFDHHQIQEVVEAALPAPLGEALHAQVAEALQKRTAGKDPKDADGALAVEIAGHALAGGRGDLGRRFLDRAFDHLEKRYRNERAVALFERALAAPGLLDGTARVEMLLRLSARLDLLGRREPQRAALEEAVALADAAGEPALRAKARVSLGGLFFITSRHSEAEAALRAALDLARAAGDREMEGRATGSLGNVFLALGWYAEARVHHERHLGIARETGDREGEAAATGNLGNVFFSLGRYAEAREHHERTLAIAREIGARRNEAIATGRLGTVFWYVGRYGEAREHHERSLALAREIGNRQIEAVATGSLGEVFTSLGRYAEAREHFERSLAIAREIGDRRGEAYATGNLGNVFSSLGQYAEARKHHERHLAVAREIGNRRSEAVARCNLRSVFHQLGRYAEAREHHERHLAIARETGDRSQEANALAGLGALAHAEGDTETARRCHEEALAQRRALGENQNIAESLSALAELDREAGDTERAMARLAEALALAGEVTSPERLLLASARRARLSGGDPAAALATLAECEHRAPHPTRMEARFILWQISGDRAHLAEAKRLLDFMVRHAPEDCRESMLVNVRPHREIAAAAKEAGV